MEKGRERRVTALSCLSVKKRRDGRKVTSLTLAGLSPLQEADEAEKRREASERARYHMEMRMMDMMRLEDRRTERQMLEMTALQPVRGVGAAQMMGEWALPYAAP